ncbi:hypothetical protein D9758_018015 [Tetrapyrgos nigripes]|uniref:Uncharacterized protein n=1 Tax=Tetrapyrgos nigripes TaxID=182062 RepID=A0A8H5FHZ0_9AGAR|nr:hypothetical protein D9758_018015 [Tetrapyrgos nigripes]
MLTQRQSLPQVPTVPTPVHPPSPADHLLRMTLLKDDLAILGSTVCYGRHRTRGSEEEKPKAERVGSSSCWNEEMWAIADAWHRFEAY